MENEDLQKFRQLWITEVQERALTSTKKQDAQSYYSNGITAERQGEMSTAIHNYRIALRLDPDIEKKYRARENTDERQHSPVAAASASAGTLKDTALADTDCSREREPVVQKSRLLKLPVEILVKILSWCAYIDIGTMQQVLVSCSLLSRL
ncbi:hypothetical protein HDU91_002168, partial [Kappamyces sp. JEL0680]